jgi:hypothetical protein
VTAARVLGLGALGAACGYAVSQRPEHAAAGAVAGVVAGVFASAAGGGPGAPSAPPAGGGGGSGGGRVFRTPVDAVEEHPSGWAPIGEGIEVTRLPVLDARFPHLFARLTYDDAAAVARARGWRMMTPPVGLAVWRQGFRLAPCLLTPSDQMASRAWCEDHDRCVAEQLAGERARQGNVRESWDGIAPVANCGKDWIEGALPGWSLNWGWLNASGIPIQAGRPGQQTHDRSHVDYSQLSRFWRAAGTV